MLAAYGSQAVSDNGTETAMMAKADRPVKNGANKRGVAEIAGENVRHVAFAQAAFEQAQEVGKLIPVDVFATWS